MNLQKITNPFPYSDSNKRYHTQNYYLRRRFGGKVIKVSLNGGFTCPNIDGRKGRGGCSYCSAAGSGDFAGDPALSISEQFYEVKNKLSAKWGEGLYIPYFQANSSTYAPLSRLRLLYEEALSLPSVVGLSVSTRPDCISKSTADYLAELSKRTYLTVELGLQSAHDETGVRINRCHSFRDFTDCCAALQERGINVVAHIINGLPGESREMMLRTAAECAKLRLHGIKIHLLHIIRGTAMERQYLAGEFEVMGLCDYVSTVCDQIELLPPEMIVERVTGDGAAADLVAPLWSLKKFVVMNEIDKELLRRGSYQGRLYRE